MFRNIPPLRPPPHHPSPSPQLNECFVRGNCIKYFRVPEDTVEKVKEESLKRPAEVNAHSFPLLLRYSIPRSAFRPPLQFKPPPPNPATPPHHFQFTLPPLSRAFYITAPTPQISRMPPPPQPHRNPACAPAAAAAAVAASEVRGNARQLIVFSLFFMCHYIFLIILHVLFIFIIRS